jgi:hypothetical protein
LNFGLSANEKAIFVVTNLPDLKLSPVKRLMRFLLEICDRKYSGSIGEVLLLQKLFFRKDNLSLQFKTAW